MSEATMTSKGQVTIPAEIRRALGLNARDRLTFTPMPDGTVVLQQTPEVDLLLAQCLRWRRVSPRPNSPAPNRVLKIPVSPSVSSHLEENRHGMNPTRAALMTIPAAFPADCATAIVQRSCRCKNNVFNNHMPQSKWRDRATGLRYGASKLPSRVRLYAVKLSSA